RFVFAPASRTRPITPKPAAIHHARRASDFLILGNFRPRPVRVHTRNPTARASSARVLIELLEQPSRFARAALGQPGSSREGELRVAVSEPRHVKTGPETRHRGMNDDRDVVEPGKQDFPGD